MKNKFVGITGSSGFVGKALMEKLRLMGGQPVGLFRSDNVGNYYTRDQNIYSTSGADVLKNMGCIVHCGARVHRQKFSLLNKKSYYEDNVLNTIELARRANKSGVKRFIFLSTVKVNGEQSAIGLPFSLNDFPCPRGNYAISKYQAELELIELAKISEMEIVILRVPLVYGKNAKANFKTLLKLISKGIPLPFKGENKCLRSFLHIDNLIDLIIKCIVSEVKLNDIFYASDNDDTSIERLIILINYAMGTQSRLFYLPFNIFNMLNKIPYVGNLTLKLTSPLQVDISETMRKLEWKPVVNLQEGLLRSIKGSDENNQNKDNLLG